MKISKHLTQIVVIIMIGLFMSGCGQRRPTEGDGKAAILKLIKERDSTGAVKLLNFRKTNGREIEGMGIKAYDMDYEYEIEVARDWDSGLFLCKGIIKGGHRVKVTGRMEFEKTDNGWQYSSLIGWEGYSCTVTAINDGFVNKPYKMAAKLDKGDFATLSAFAQQRQTQMKMRATSRGLSIPLSYQEFFKTVEANDWCSTSNAYYKAKLDVETSRNELWQYVLETYGAFEQFAMWKPTLLHRYEEEIQRVISKDSIYFGGTDPGRFVPTLLQETSPIPFYVITQNLLFDDSYMNFLRTRCDSSVLLPTPEKCHNALKQVVEDVRTGRLQPGADVRIENDGSVGGVVGVMAINGIISKWIFDKNKDKHSFYVEESYVIPWMYPYLRPAGVIMKLETEPLPTPQQDAKYWQQLINNDSAYWGQLLGEFTKRSEFKHDRAAKMAFSKLRCAIAGIYEFRGIVNAAEKAYQDAVSICPDSPEAAFRLSNLYMRLNQMDKAIQTLKKLREHDPSNNQVREALAQYEAIQNAKKPAH